MKKKVNETIKFELNIIKKWRFLSEIFTFKCKEGRSLFESIGETKGWKDSPYRINYNNKKQEQKSGQLFLIQS